MKKVTLIDCVYNDGTIPPNFGLGMIEKSLINRDIEVNICDFVRSDLANCSLNDFLNAENDYIRSSVEISKDSDIVYISGSHGNEMKPYAIFPRISKISKSIKASNKNVKIILGGALANYYTTVLGFNSKHFENFFIDYIITGPEASCSNNIIEMLDFKTLNENYLPLYPVWDGWNLEKYPNYMGVFTSIGCPHKCSFCFEGKVFFNHDGAIQVEDIINVTKSFSGRRNISGVLIEDSISISYPKFRSVMDALRETGVNWAIYARSSEIIKNKNLIKDIKNSGCKSFIVGIEAFEDELLSSTNKKIFGSQNMEALHICEEEDISVQGCFILGFPGDKPSTITRRLETAQKLNLDMYRWHILQPDWSNLPKNIKGMQNFKIEDHFNMQVSVPDTCLPELIDRGDLGLVYDEHVLIRLAPHYEKLDILKNYGYENGINFFDMMNILSDNLKHVSLPTNEDHMYNNLFNPTMKCT